MSTEELTKLLELISDAVMESRFYSWNVKNTSLEEVVRKWANIRRELQRLGLDVDQIEDFIDKTSGSDYM